MKQLGISNQIIIIAIFPALIVAAILSTYFMLDQFNYISESLNRHGKLIVKQLSPAAEYAVYSGNVELIKPLINTTIKNNPILRIQILDKNNNSILDITSPEKPAKRTNSIFEKFLDNKKQIEFHEPIISQQITVDDDEDQPANTSIENNDNQVGNVIVTLTTQYANQKKIQQIKHGVIVTLIILLLTTLIIIRISRTITQPIKSLTHTVRNIASGDLDTRIEKNSTGEIGVLQSCINHMAEELKHFQSDMENKLDEYTDELQQTMEELEIRNAELDITRSKAIYANNAKSEFLANMSHEIRTPLSGIVGFTELLQGTQLSEQQKDYTYTVQKSAKALLEIINDILDLSKIESGKTEITTSEFNLIDILEDIINLLSPIALEKNVELFYRVEKNVPNIISSDPFRIHQVLTNLIGNAIKFTDQGYVYLQVTAGEIKDTETSIVFSVSDTGIGMNDDDKKNLFKAFTQADTTITRRFGGTGLGLVISRKLAILMKGEINFDSTEGEGSTFWFNVPVTPVPEEYKKSELADKKIAFVSNHFIAKQTFKTLFNNYQCHVSDYSIKDLNDLANIEQDNDIVILFLSRKEINNPATFENINKLAFSKPSLLIASTRSHTELRNLQQHVFDNAVFTSEKTDHIKQKLVNTINKNVHQSEIDDTDNNITSIIDWSNINVMVVDDNDVNLRLAEIILHKHKARVTTASSGAQAIDYASMNSFDIIFMDLHMPGIDGYVTTRKIKEITTAKQPVIIALTANALPHEKEKTIQSGMNGILIKPVSDAMLQKVISDWVLNEPINNTKRNKLNINSSCSNEQSNDNQKTVFSINKAREFTGNNEELAYELFGMLRAELDSYSKNIITAVKNNDLTKLHEQVHKLHGASRCCGTTELKETSSHIENLIDQKVNFDIEKETSLLLTAIQNVSNYKINSGNIDNIQSIDDA
jgi:two-component system sensor histidine kinase BarA